MVYSVKEFPLYSMSNVDIIHHEFRNIFHFFTYIYVISPSSIIVVKFMSSQYNSLPFTFLSHPHHIFMHLASNGNHHHLHESHESWLICIEIENYKFRFHFSLSIFFWLSLWMFLLTFSFALVMFFLLLLHLNYAWCALLCVY